eukprot:gene4595-6778_t
MGSWYNDHSTAVQAAREKKGILVVFVYDESPESDAMALAWNTPDVETFVSEATNIFRVKFSSSDAAAELFKEAFPQATFPCTLIFDAQTRQVRAMLPAPVTEGELLQALIVHCSTQISMVDIQEQPHNKSEPSQLEQRKEEMQKKIEQARLLRQKKELEKAKTFEKSRREQAKAAQSAQKQYEEEQRKRHIEETRAERRRDQQRKDEIRKKIQESRSQQSANEKLAMTTTLKLNEGALLFRFPDLSTHELSFRADSTMQQVYSRVEEILGESTDHFMIRQPYPSRILDNDDKTLRDLGLLPRARLLVVIPEQPKRPPGFCEWLTKLVTSFFKPESPPHTQSSSVTQRSSTNSRDLRHRVRRFGSDKDSDKLAADNGNSTQFQM